MRCFKWMKGLAVAVAFTCLFAGGTMAAGESSGGITPDEALQRVQEGNARYVEGKSEYPRVNQERRSDTAKNGQRPYVSILSCSDSRVPLEYIFDQGIGDIFAVRVAGNVADVDEIGSVEYGVGHLGTPLLLVLGHTKCGAVTAVVKGDKVSGSIPKLVDNIIPAVKETKKLHPELKTDELIGFAIEANVWQSIKDTFVKSEEVRKLVMEGKLKVVGGIYDLSDGTVRILGQHPNQAKLLGEEKKTAAPGITPDEAIKRLKEGNARYTQDKNEYPNISQARRDETVKNGQHPIATVLSCSDSREPVEMIFDQGIGDVFSVRVAGNVADTDEIGTVEYGVGHLGTPLLLVLGHTKCGAVTAVVNGDHVSGSIPKLVDNIIPAVAAAKKKNPGAKTDEIIPKAIEANIWQSIKDVITRSEEVRHLVKIGKLKVIGGVYDISDGTIKFMGQHPDEKKLLGSEGHEKGGKEGTKSHGKSSKKRVKKHH